MGFEPRGKPRLLYAFDLIGATDPGVFVHYSALYIENVDWLMGLYFMIVHLKHISLREQQQFR